VRLLEGEIGISDLHRQKLEHFSLAADRRLACMSSCTGSITLHIEQFDHLILADETIFDFIPQ
jgi:hypothetical protein